MTMAHGATMLRSFGWAQGSTRPSLDRRVRQSHTDESAFGASQRRRGTFSLMTRSSVLSLSLALAVVATAPSAYAQVYLTTERAETYIPLAQRGVTVTAVAFSSRDEGSATLNLPFTFRFFGSPQTSVWISTNGILQFGPGPRPGFTNYAPASSSARDGIIAAWWDDLIVPAATGNARTAIVGTAPDRAFVIEVENWERFGLSGLNDGAYQVWLYEGNLGRFEVRYDRTLTVSENYSATVGYRSLNGTQVASFRPCADTASCDETDYATLTGRVVDVALVNQPELVGELPTVPRGALPGQTLNVPVTVRNIGPLPAVATEAVLRLSADEVVDAADIEVGRIAVPALPGEQARALTAAITIPATSTLFDAFLLLEVDAGQAVTEASETNNVTASATRFATAADLRVVSVGTPPGGNPSDPLSVPITFENVGVLRTGTLTVEVRASLDEIYQPTDALIGSTSLSLATVGQQTLTVAGRVPNVPPGRYYALVRVDSTNAIPEYDETNNVGRSAMPFARGPDLVPVGLVGPAGASVGSAITIGLTLNNTGTSFTGPVAVTLKLSPDALHDITDPTLSNHTVAVSGPTLTTDLATSVPPTLAVGTYYPIVVVDPADLVAEITNGNNIYAAATPILVGPDFVVTDIQGPTAGNPLDTVTVTTDIGSIGAAYAGGVNYALYLSADDTFDAQDILLNTYTANVQGPGASDTRNILLPANAVGDFRFIAVVDPGRTIDEASETNNVFVDRTEAEFGVDLRLFSVNFTPSEVDPTGRFDYSTTLRVDSNPLTADVPYRVLLSRDGTLDPADRVVATGALPVVGQGSFPLSGTADLAAVMPPVAPGEYNVIVDLDPNDQILERIEDNNDNDSFSDLRVQGPNLSQPVVISADQGFAGEAFVVTLTLFNDGDGDVGRVEYTYYASRDGVVTNGVPLATRAVNSIPAGGQLQVIDSFVLTSTLSRGPITLGVVVDPNDRIDEINELDNVGQRGATVLIRSPVADVFGRIIASSTAAAAGESFGVTTVLENGGFINAPSFEYGYALVPEAGGPDIPMGRQTLSLESGGFVRLVEVVDVPPTVVPGAYRLAVVLDPDDALEEVDEGNNRTVGPAVQVLTPDLQIVTERPPEGRVGEPYGVGLRAVGGAFGRTWSVAEGRLPVGVTLSSTGRLAGTPRVDGVFSFLAEVRSGNSVAQRALDLVVREVEFELAVVEVNLPPALLERPYDTAVVAVGGQSPLSWAAIGLPQGLAMQPSGVIQGTAVEIGDFSVTLQVRDALGAGASGTTLLRVLDPSTTVRISSLQVPPGVIDQPYCDAEPTRLFANGGIRPYVWSATGLPPGLTLSDDGTLCGTPTELGRFSPLVTVADATGQVDTTTLPLDILSSDTVVIRNLALAPVSVGVPYTEVLEAVGGQGPYRWTAAFGALPPGIVLGEDGRFSGQSSSAGLYPFAVRVLDARGTEALRALSIDVINDTAPSGQNGGCRCVPSSSRAPSSLWVLVLAVGWLRRRRH